MTDEPKRYGLRYVGERFDGARMPLEVLLDLPAFRDLLAAIAKQQFRKRNVDRQRVPRGFDRSISFSLVRIDDGSAIPQFVLDRDVAQQSLPNMGYQIDNIVDDAFNEVAKIIDDASQNVFPDALPSDAIRAMSKFGSSLRSDERIELQGSRGTSGAIVSFDSERRKRILTQVRETYTSEIEDVGILIGLDVKRNVIQVDTDQFGEIKLDLNQIEAKAESFDGFIGSEIEFTILAALDAHDELTQVESVVTADIVRPYDEHVLRCLRRLRELSEIEPGWLGEGAGSQVVHLAATRASQLIFTRAEFAKFFRLYPTEDGGVSIEFDVENWSFAVETLPDGSIEIDASSSSGDVFEEKTFQIMDREFFTAFDEMVSSVNVEN